jgi:AraC-like DNA-binding protein
MALKDVVGVNIDGCYHRKNYRQYYYNRKTDRIPNNELILITGGRIFFVTDKRRFWAEKNDVVCFGPGFHRESFPESGTAVSYFMLTLDIYSGTGKALKFTDICFPFLIKAGAPEKIAGILKRICRASLSSEESRVPACSVLGVSLLQEIQKDIRRKEKAPFREGRGMHFRIREALDHIRKNYKQPLKVSTLAKLACMHTDYFAHLFKRETGVSPHGYILSHKIRKARDFLAHYDEALVYTAEELGFHDYSHFYRAFKKETGQSPREYVKSAKRVYDPR